MQLSSQALSLLYGGNFDKLNDMCSETTLWSSLIFKRLDAQRKKGQLAI